MFGAGLLRDGIELADRCWRVDAVETPNSVNRRMPLYSDFAQRAGCRVITGLRTTRRDRVITVTHVLDLIEDPRSRNSLDEIRARYRDD